MALLIVAGYHFFVAVGAPPKLSTFAEAKKLARAVYADHQQTFYCGCRFDSQGTVDLQSCGYQSQGSRRAMRVEWEHIVPASHLAMQRPCGQKKLCCRQNGKCFQGRLCCREIDAQFSEMEADLHNLVPVIGELNALRSDYRFDLLPKGRSGQFGRCAVKIDTESRRMEPSPKVQGIIARAYLYMAKTYQLSISDSQLHLFNAWNRAFPPDPWEVEWDKRVAHIQGNHNTYIAHYEKMKHDD